MDRMGKLINMHVDKGNGIKCRLSNVTFILIYTKTTTKTIIQYIHQTMPHNETDIYICHEESLIRELILPVTISRGK